MRTLCSYSLLIQASAIAVNAPLSLPPSCLTVTYAKELAHVLEGRVNADGSNMLFIPKILRVLHCLFSTFVCGKSQIESWREDPEFHSLIFDVASYQQRTAPTPASSPLCSQGSALSVWVLTTEVLTGEAWGKSGHQGFRASQEGLVCSQV